MKKILVLILILFFAPCAFGFNFFKQKQKFPAEGGYVGTLPNVAEKFQKPQIQEAAPVFDRVESFRDQSQIKPLPRDNPAFVNIILKKDKTSQYLNDINDVILALEKLANIIETKQDIQRFNAEAYYVKANVEYLRNKYKNKSETSYVSYQKLMKLNLQIQTIAQLRSDGSKYSQYLASSDGGYVYNENNIDKQMDYLLQEINDTLFVLRDVR
ncbi:MAG TPA: hypothetical protein PLG15_02920 [Candidatus Gastranaerophilaceae bacterium]|nr:hypothetical protein [Candidatus Gastranaerophilaceae bacterium]HPT41316.1 hypothetical protein [Candidatus Gastranaerophilaceae bacterium]